MHDTEMKFKVPKKKMQFFGSANNKKKTTTMIIIITVIIVTGLQLCFFQKITILMITATFWTQMINSMPALYCKITISFQLSSIINNLGIFCIYVFIKQDLWIFEIKSNFLMVLKFFQLPSTFSAIFVNTFSCRL